MTIPGYEEKTVKRKFPLKTLALGIGLCVAIIIILGLTVPGLGPFLIGGAIGLGLAIIGFFAVAIPQVLVTAGIILGVIGLYYYRKIYGKKKVLQRKPAAIPTHDTLSEPVFSDDVKVETT